MKVTWIFFDEETVVVKVVDVSNEEDEVLFARAELAGEGGGRSPAQKGRSTEGSCFLWCAKP